MGAVGLGRCVGQSPSGIAEAFEELAAEPGIDGQRRPIDAFLEDATRPAARNAAPALRSDDVPSDARLAARTAR